METSTFLLVCTLVTLCMMPSAFALTCGVCTNTTGIPGAEKCDSDNVGNWTCPQGWDRCLTMHYTPKNSSMLLEIRNCTSTAGCDPLNQYYACNYVNDTGTISTCSTTCCEEDMCNLAGPSPTMSTMKTTQAYSTTMEATSAVLGLAASFFAMSLVLALTVLV